MTSLHDLTKRLDELSFERSEVTNGEIWEGVSSMGTVSVFLCDDGSIHLAKMPMDSDRCPVFAWFTAYDPVVTALVEAWKR